MWEAAARRRMMATMTAQKLQHQRVEKEVRGGRLLLVFVEEEKEVKEQL